MTTPADIIKRASTARLFAAFSTEVERVRSWVASAVPRIQAWSHVHLQDRLIQRIVDAGMAPFAQSVHARLSEAECLPPAGTEIRCDRFVMHVGSGKITMTAGHLVANLRDFIVHWAYCLAMIVVVRRRQKNGPAAVLLYNVVRESLFRDGSDERFVAYCDSGPIGPLASGRRFYVGCDSAAVSRDVRFTYCRNPLIALFNDTALGFRSRFHLLLEHMLLLVGVPLAVARTPLLSLLGRDLAYTKITEELDDRGLIDAVVLTCEAWGSQPLWMRRLRKATVHMVWYSQSPQSASYTSDEQTAVCPRVKWIAVDTHWVWTRGLAEYLSRHIGKPQRMEIVGPIVWQLPESGERRRGEVRLLAFDVPAVVDSMMRDHGGELTNYYAQANLQAFIRDVVSLKGPLEHALGTRVSVYIKMKRGIRPHYERDYYSFVEQLSASGDLIPMDPSENIFSLISASDMVIAYPFTSPAYVAEWLRVPAIFYDPTSLLVRDDFSDSVDAVRFARGPMELLQCSLQLLQASGRAAAGVTA